MTEDVVKYHLDIKYDDGIVMLTGRMRLGGRIASSCECFGLMERDRFYKGDSFIPYRHGKMRSKLLRLTGIYPPITRLTIRGDQEWMNDADRDIIAHYFREIERGRTE